MYIYLGNVFNAHCPSGKLWQSNQSYKFEYILLIHYSRIIYLSFRFHWVVAPMTNCPS